MLKALLSPQRSETNTGRVVEVDLEALVGQEESGRRSAKDERLSSEFDREMERLERQGLLE
jgi:hypothetical protein